MAFNFHGFPRTRDDIRLSIRHLDSKVAARLVSNCHCTARSLETGTWITLRAYIRSGRMDFDEAISSKPLIDS